MIFPCGRYEWSFFPHYCYGSRARHAYCNILLPPFCAIILATCTPIAESYSHFYFFIFIFCIILAICTPIAESAGEACGRACDVDMACDGIYVSESKRVCFLIAVHVCLRACVCGGGVIGPRAFRLIVRVVL